MTALAFKPTFRSASIITADRCIAIMLITTTSQWIKTAVHNSGLIALTEQFVHSSLTIVLPEGTSRKLGAIGEASDLLAHHPGTDVIESCPT